MGRHLCPPLRSASPSHWLQLSAAFAQAEEFLPGPSGRPGPWALMLAWAGSPGPVAGGGPTEGHTLLAGLRGRSCL